jgi:translation initiation factor IF-2
MTDQRDVNQGEKKPLTLTKKLELKTVVDPNARSKPRASGGKTVVVEVKKARGASGATVRPVTPSSSAPPISRMRGEQVSPPTTKKTISSPVAPAKEKPRPTIDGLTSQERTARLNALKDALKAAAEEEVREEERSRQQHEREALEAEAALLMAQEEEERKAELAKSEEDKPQEIPTKNNEPSLVEEVMLPPIVVEDTSSNKRHKPKYEGDEDDNFRGKSIEKKIKKEEVKKPVVVRKEGERRLGKISVSQALGSDEEGSRMRSLASIRRAREKERQKMGGMDQLQQKIVREVTIPEVITVQELANRMAERSSDVIKTLMKMGMMATITQAIDADTAQLVAEELGHAVKRVSDADIEINLFKSEEDTPDKMKPRAPVVTVMGHVDHGKTSLLDAIRETDVVQGEAGGITQHIGAYQVMTKEGKPITFIDTPGHAAFTEMRARGANVTDIVILVVAADDGVKDQTIEAIQHAKAANVPLVVAVNKIDKPGSDPLRARTALLQHGVAVEEMGGEILSADVSAKNRMNLERLEELILLQAELLDLKANPDRTAIGVVVEAKLEKGRGPVATVLIQNGTLKVGDVFVAGAQWGRVRALLNDRGARLSDAGPSVPVEVIGFDGAPEAGDGFVVVQDEAKARELASYRERKKREKAAALQDKHKLENMFSRPAGTTRKEFSILIKSDVQGSAEAISASLQKLATEEIGVKILFSSVGGINETDIALARTSNAMVVGFNVRANSQAREMAVKEGVEIRYYSIIYNVIDDVKALMGGMLSPILQENFIGRAQIREVFKVGKSGTIAGCYVTEGIVKRGSKVRLLRDDVVVHEGTLKSLRRFKDEVKEVKENFECGMAFENYNDIRVGDIIECSEIESIARTL